MSDGVFVLAASGAIACSLLFLVAKLQERGDRRRNR